MDAEMPDRGPTVRAYLESRMDVDKADVIDRTVKNLDAEGYRYVEELKELTYDEVIGLKLPVFAAKKLQLHLKLLVPPAPVPAANLVPFSDVPSDFKLPFRGRDILMEKVTGIINSNFMAFASSGISREQALFVTLEGLAGVGKTRILLEAKQRVGEVLKGRTSELARLHCYGATAAVYITFNGSAVGASSPHFLHPAFVAMCKERDGRYAGRGFMRACLVSQILYGKPWVGLPSKLQDEILGEDDLVSLQKVSAHVRSGLSITQDDQMVTLYLLLDESQQLGREVSEAGCDGDDFLRGMLSWLVTVMTTSVGNSLAKDCNIAFITLLAGTVLPVGGRYGVSDWLKVNITVPPLDMRSALEVLSMSINDNRFEEFRTQLEILLEDCGCFPRLIRFIYSAWLDALTEGLPAQDLIAYLRTSVTLELKKWVDRILIGNTDKVKRMVRLCLTRLVMQKPPVGETTWEAEECFNGYVYSEEVEGGVIYRSPMLLIHELGLKLGIPERIVAFRPQPAVEEVLENGFLDMLHARLCVLEGQTLSLGQIFPGARGNQGLLDIKVVVEAHGDGVVEEQYQFYNRNTKTFYSQMMGKDGNLYVHPTEASPTCAGYVFKCRRGTVPVDGRVFLIGVDGQVYEIWLMLKGHGARVGANEATGWAKAAHSYHERLEGRRMVYVLGSRQGFSFQGTCEGDVLLLDLVNFMPEFLRRCQLG